MEVDVHHVRDVGRGELRDRRALRDGGVVDERVEATERVPRFEGDRFGAFEVAEIGHPHPRLGRVTATLLEHRFEAIGPARDDADGCSGRRELWRERGTDAR